jgi:hypothetical protein
LAFASLAAAFLAGPAAAHHSFAMFDADRLVTLTGTVKEFEWTNPHSWLYLVVQGTDGKVAEWSLEMAGTGSNTRTGWKPDSVKPGDKVSVEIHPMKTGARGGQLLSAVLPSGQKLGVGGRPNDPLGQ